MDDSVLKSPKSVFLFALRPFWISAITIGILIVVGNAVAYLVPLYLKEIGNIAAQVSGGLQWGNFLKPFLVIAALSLGAEIAWRIAHGLQVFLVPKFFQRITANLFAWVLMQPAAYFEERLSGELGRRVEQIGANTLYFIETLPWEMGWQVVGIATIVFMLATANLFLAGTLLLWLILFTAISYPLLAWEFRAAEKAATAQADVSGQAVDTFGNVAVVHTFAAHEHEHAVFGSVLATAVLAERRARIANLVNKAFQGMSVVVLNIGLTAVSINLFLKGEITVGDFVLVATAIVNMAAVVWTTGDTLVRATRNFGEFRSAVAGLQSLTAKVPDGVGVLSVQEGRINLEHVSFAYPSTSIEAVRNLTLSIRAGEKVGLVGKSGAGKSTIVKLLLRQYDPTSGSIEIDGKNIRETTLVSLRKSITFVPQDTSLFQRTLYENILYARPEASKEEVLAASHKAHADDFISQYPTGYDTKVGERGVKLSGGQRQRIALARAMLKDAPILVLDEATSALDSESEEIVQKGLQELFGHKTVIAIAHRLSTLRAMDRIVVLDEGQIVEDGAPQELLTRENGIFKEMWEHQKSGFIT